jgi:hypothetical protein
MLPSVAPIIIALVWLRTIGLLEGVVVKGKGQDGDSSLITVKYGGDGDDGDSRRINRLALTIRLSGM